jgi:hypothetical protein
LAGDDGHSDTVAVRNDLGGGDAAGVELLCLGRKPLGAEQIMVVEDGQRELAFPSGEPETRVGRAALQCEDPRVVQVILGGHGVDIEVLDGGVAGQAGSASCGDIQFLPTVLDEALPLGAGLIGSVEPFGAG